MLYAYIGTAVVVGLLVIAVTLCVIWLSKKVSAGIQAKTMDVISAYDELLEKRSQELAQLEAAIQERAASVQTPLAGPVKPEVAADPSGASVVSAAERIMASAYRDSEVGSAYRKIRTSFHHSPEEVLRHLSETLQTDQSGAATSLLEELSYNTIYRLSTLDAKDQEVILRSSLTGESLALLDSYAKTTDLFSAISFYDYLQSAAAMEPQKPRMRVPLQYSGPIPDGVEVIEDADICEGFQLEVYGNLYDYCIKGRELS